jgi:hypothetical protein
MKRIITISLLLVAVTAVTVLFLMHRGSSGDLKMKVAPGTVVTKVVLQKGDEKIVLNEKKGSRILNGKEEARKAAITFLLATLEGMEPKSPVSEKTFDELIVKFSGRPVAVRVYSGHRKVKSFIVYHFNDPDYGSVFRKSAGSTPYLVYLPGYDFDAGSVFTSETDYWRPFTVFEIMPSEIAKVKMDFSGDPSRSFVIFKDKGIAILEGTVSFDTTAVKRYISYFVNVPFESINTGMDKQGEASVAGSSPVFTLTVTTNDGESHVLRGWRRQSGTEADTDRLWGKLDDGRLFVMRYLDIDPLLKKRSYFLVSK